MSTPAPPDPARLAELRRQREMAVQHLAWLDQEIAAASASPPAQPRTTSVLGSGTSPPAIAPAPKQVESLNLSRPDLAPDFTPDPGLQIPLPEPAAGISPRERRGCIIAGAVVILLITAAMFVLPYLIFRH